MSALPSSPHRKRVTHCCSELQEPATLGDCHPQTLGLPPWPGCCHPSPVREHWHQLIFTTRCSVSPFPPTETSWADSTFQDLQGAHEKGGEGLFTSHTSFNIWARQAGPNKRAQQDEQLFQKTLGHLYLSLPTGVMFPAAATFLKCKHKCLQENLTLGFRSTLLRRSFH